MRAANWIDKGCGARRTLSLIACLVLAGCDTGEPQPEELVTRSSALSAITISGVVTDVSGITLGDIRVTLNGSKQATATTDFQGRYSFSVNPGSYSVAASGMCSSFEPGVVNLNNLNANATANFVGSGGFCSPQTFSGGLSGSLTISGTVSAGGHAVPGAQITLAGSTTGFRFADQTGAYSFSVNPGAYSVRVTGGCSSFTPSVANLNNITTSQTQNFTGSGNCPIAPLALCPTFDTSFGFSEPASCNLVSSPSCAFDRSSTWASQFLFDFSNALTPDCRFGQWFTGSGALTQQDITNYINDLLNFALYFMGCPATGTVVGPLSFSLIPSAFAGHVFTTADVQALSTLYSNAIAQSLVDVGAPPLTAAQTSSINAQLAALAANVPNLVNSSTFTFSTCP